MTKDPTLYTEEGQLVAKDITIRTYFPLDNDQLVIDLDKYYDGLCCFEVVAVESRKSGKTKGIFITYDKRRIIYKACDTEHSGPDEFELWSQVGATDTIRYVVKDVNTGQTSTGTIVIERIEHGTFKAADLCVSFPVDTFNMEGWFGFPRLQMDLAWVNKQDSVRIVEVGDYNEKIFRSVAINIDKQSELVVDFATECMNLNVGRTTEIEYAIEAEVNGEKSISKAKVIFTFFTRTFHAEYIEVSVESPTPSEKYINVLDYNPTFANVGLLDVDVNTPSARGSVFIDHAMSRVRYEFNHGSGYWDNPEAVDVLRYRLINHNSGQEACNYIILEKNKGGSGSGSGWSGSGWSGSGWSGSGWSGSGSGHFPSVGFEVVRATLSFSIGSPNNSVMLVNNEAFDFDSVILAVNALTEGTLVAYMGDGTVIPGGMPVAVSLSALDSMSMYQIYIQIEVAGTTYYYSEAITITLGESLSIEMRP